MKSIFLISATFLISFTPVLSQKSQTSTIEIVKSISGNSEEAIYFYENNWKVFREKAKVQNYIVDFNILISDTDQNNDVEIALITNFRDKTQFLQREENFAKIMSEFGENGPQLMNTLMPNEFRVRVFKNTMNAAYADTTNIEK